MNPNMACRAISVSRVRHIVRRRLRRDSIRLTAEAPGAVMTL